MIDWWSGSCARSTAPPRRRLPPILTRTRRRSPCSPWASCADRSATSWSVISPSARACRQDRRRRHELARDRRFGHPSDQGKPKTVWGPQAIDGLGGPGRGGLVAPGSRDADPLRHSSPARRSDRSRCLCAGQRHAPAWAVRPGPCGGRRGRPARHQIGPAPLRRGRGDAADPRHDRPGVCRPSDRLRLRDRRCRRPAGRRPGQSASRDPRRRSRSSLASGSDDDTIALNRGHALLSLQRPREALAEFRRSPCARRTRRWPGSARASPSTPWPIIPPPRRPFARLCGSIPSQNAARINLAMTLGEEGKIDEALAAWEDILAASPEAPARRRSRRAIQQRSKSCGRRGSGRRHHPRQPRARNRDDRDADGRPLVRAERPHRHASWSFRPSTAGPARGEGFALIVGVNECPAFRLPDGSRPRPLQGAENDADALADLLIRQFGFAAKNVVVLKGAGATREKIKAAFVELAERAPHRRPVRVPFQRPRDPGPRRPAVRRARWAGRGALSLGCDRGRGESHSRRRAGILARRPARAGGSR